MQAKGRKRGMNTVENLAKQLVAAIREEARAELSETVRTALGVPPRSLQFERQDARRYAAKARAKKNGLATHGAGQKRDPAAIAKLTESLHETIKANPGQRMETHQAALGLKAKDVMLPIKKLIAAKRIRFQGDKRARRYWAK
jgi:hypothetical protein